MSCEGWRHFAMNFLKPGTQGYELRRFGVLHHEFLEVAVSEGWRHTVMSLIRMKGHHYEFLKVAHCGECL